MRDFAMFTPEGNALIQGIVLTAQYKKEEVLDLTQAREVLARIMAK